jgi:hypothetical protein
MIVLALASLLVAQADPAPDSWREGTTERGAVLSFGEAANAEIVLSCARPGVIRADLSGLYTGEGREPTSITVISGRARATFRLAYDGGFSAEIPATAPVMRAFGQSARVTFRASSGELTGDGAPAQASIVAAFLQRCR